MGTWSKQCLDIGLELEEHHVTDVEGSLDQCLSAYIFMRCWAWRRCWRTRSSIVEHTVSIVSTSDTDDASGGERPKWRGVCPYSTSNGDLLSEEWRLVLYQYSTKLSHRNHCLGQEWTKQRRNALRHWFTRSVWPSD